MPTSITKGMLANALQRLEALDAGDEVCAEPSEELRERAEEVAELALKAVATCVKYDLSNNAESTIEGLGTFVYAGGQVQFTPEEHVLKYAALKEQDFESTQLALRNAIVHLLSLVNGLVAEAELEPAATVDPAMYTSSEDKLMAAVLGATRPNRFDETVYRLIGNLIDQLRSAAGLNISLSSADKPDTSKVVFHERAKTPVPSSLTEALSGDRATEPLAKGLVGAADVVNADDVAKRRFYDQLKKIVEHYHSREPSIEDFWRLGRSLSAATTLAEAQRILTEFQAPQTPSKSPGVSIVPAVSAHTQQMTGWSFDQQNLRHYAVSLQRHNPPNDIIITDNK